MNDQLANDRTFLAWFRTGHRPLRPRRGHRKGRTHRECEQHQSGGRAFYAVVGIVSVLCGALLVIVGYFQHRRVRHLVTSNVETALPRWPLATTACAVGGAVLLFVLLGVSA